MTQIIIKRSSEHINKFRDIKILINGNPVGSISDGESKVFEVSPGEHTVRAKIDWCGSPERKVLVRNGEETTIILRGFKGSEYVGGIYFKVAGVLLIICMLLSRRIEVFNFISYIITGVCAIPLLGIVYIFTIGRNRYLSFEPANDRF